MRREKKERTEKNLNEIDTKLKEISLDHGIDATHSQDDVYAAAAIDAANADDDDDEYVHCACVHACIHLCLFTTHRIHI